MGWEAALVLTLMKVFCYINATNLHLWSRAGGHLKKKKKDPITFSHNIHSIMYLKSFRMRNRIILYEDCYLGFHIGYSASTGGF